MQKAYNRINWENYPSEETPVNASNLNRMDYAINEIDNRVIALNTDKLSATDANTMITNVVLNDETGDITLTKYDGSTAVLHTNIAKIVLNWRYDYSTQQLILTQSDGTSVSIDLSTLIQNNEFGDTDNIAFNVSSAGIVTASIKAHSISDTQLRTDYLADIRVAEANAAASETSAEAHDISSQSWAIGGTQTRQGEDTNNSMYYSQLADASRQAAELAKSDAEDLVEIATKTLTNLTVQVNLTDGHLYYDAPYGVIMSVDNATGRLMYDVSVA